MKKMMFFALLCRFFAPVHAQNESAQYEKRSFKTSFDSTLSYRILYPKDFDATKKYPLVVFLHGAGERGDDNEQQLTHGANLFLKPTNRDSFPCIVVFPQCPKHDYWSSVKIDRTTTPYQFDFDYTRKATNALASVADLVYSLKDNNYVDPTRIYIMGLSMGGMGTFEIAARQPKLFAAAISICGGGDTLHLPRRIRRIPFWVLHGTADPVVGVKESQRMVAALTKRKASVKYSEYPNVGHGSWTNAFAEPQLLQWLFSNKK
jgi:predicted peptidase